MSEQPTPSTPTNPDDATPLDALLQGYRARHAGYMPENTTTAEQPVEGWQKIQQALSTPCDIPEIDSDTLYEWASTWWDSPALLGEQRVAFESALPKWPQANAILAEVDALGDMLHGYRTRLVTHLETASTFDVSQQVMLRYKALQTSQPAPIQPLPVIDIFPKWFTSAAAAGLLLLTVALSQPFSPTPIAYGAYGQTTAQTARTASGLQLAHAANASNAVPSVETFMLTSCTEELPTHDWQVVTNCQY